MQLRPYQQKAVDHIRHEFANGATAPLLVVPTGGGKTVIFSYVSHNASARGNRVLILVHRIELIRQTSAKLNEFGVRHGIINDKFSPDLSAPVQIASVQTLVKRFEKYPEWWWKLGLVIVDEAHHAVGGNTWGKIIRHIGARVLGVTATPCRGDGTGLGIDVGGHFDRIVLGPTTTELIELGYLVKPVVYAPATKLDLTGVKSRGGDYEKSELEKRVDKPSITGDAVSHYSKICPGAPAVVFCVSVLHAEHVANDFRSAGYRAYAVDGSMEDDLRQRILNGLGNGSVDVVCSCDLISEGTDIPAIGCAILLRPTQSLGLYIQQVGRALRPSVGKSKAIILDHVGNVLMHGLPEEDREWSLDGERRKKKDKSEPTLNIKQCPQCYAVHEPAPICPQCGFTYIVERKRELEQHDGALREITESDKERMKKQKRQEVASARTRAELEAIARQRGYKPNWVENILKAREGKQNQNVNLPSHF